MISPWCSYREFISGAVPSPTGTSSTKKRNVEKKEEDDRPKRQELKKGIDRQKITSKLNDDG